MVSGFQYFFFFYSRGNCQVNACTINRELMGRPLRWMIYEYDLPEMHRATFSLLVTTKRKLRVPSRTIRRVSFKKDVKLDYRSPNETVPSRKFSSGAERDRIALIHDGNRAWAEGVSVSRRRISSIPFFTRHCQRSRIDFVPRSRSKHVRVI